jgi:hypothetical protein
MRWLAVLVAAAVFTGTLLVRRVGIPLTALALCAAAYGYGGWIRRAGAEEPEEGESGESASRTSPARIAGRVSAALIFGLGLAAPALLNPAGWRGEAVRFTPLTLAIAAPICLVWPLTMLVAFGQDGERPLGWRGARDVIQARIWEALATLLLVPAALVATELLTYTAANVVGWTPYMVIDLFRPPELLFREMGLEFRDYYHFDPTEVPVLGRAYRHLLTRGYSFTWGIPTTLCKSNIRLRGIWDMRLRINTFLIVRTMFTFGILVAVLAALGAQARCLGKLARLDSRTVTGRMETDEV